MIDIINDDKAPTYFQEFAKQLVKSNSDMSFFGSTTPAQELTIPGCFKTLLSTTIVDNATYVDWELVEDGIIIDGPNLHSAIVVEINNGLRIVRLIHKRFTKSYQFTCVAKEGVSALTLLNSCS